MPAHEQAFGDGALPLTATNLHSIRPTSQTDKTKLIRDFVASQEVYSARYSKEGCAISAIWDRSSPGATGNTPTRKASSREILVSAFDTPILKPRVSANAELAPGRVTRSKIREGPPSEVQGSETRPLKASNLKNLVRSGSQKENVLKIPGGHKESHRVQKDVKKAAQQTLDRYTVKAQADKQHEAPPKKRRRSPDSTDPEHAARLAERRERRRVKRAIVAPKALIDAASDEEDGSDSGAMKAPKATKQRKKKSTSLAAGLALMHGFTATNIGKNRLTVQPERRNGVFSKGKASAKVGISTKRNATAAFSECQFLSAVKRPTKSRDKTCDEASQEDSDNSSVSKPSAEDPVLRSYKGTTEFLPKRRGRKALDIAEHHSDFSEDQARPGKKKPASIVWDIEIDGKSLPSDSEPSELDDPRDGTIVLDTHAKWTADAPASVGPAAPTHVVSDDRSPSCEEMNESQSAVDASADRVSTVSLRPSESASQLPRRLLPGPHMSRFFPSLPAAPDGSANDEPMSAVGEQEMPSSRLSSRRTDLVAQPSMAEPPAGDMKMHFAPSSHVSAAQQTTDALLPIMHSPALGNSVSISMSVLDRELRALDDDDDGLLYAVYGQEHTSEEYCSVLSLAQSGPRDARPRAHSELYSIGDNGLETTPSAPSPSTPDMYTWAEQAEYLDGPAEHWGFATDAEAGSIYPAGLLDVDDGYESWHIDADEIAMTREYALASDDTPLYFAEANAVEPLRLSPVLEALPFDDDAYMSELQGFNEVDLDYLATDFRPHTATSWCSATEEPTMSSASVIASASELSAELLVPSFAQGRDLLLGLSERSGIERNPYSIMSVEEDVAKSLRGHWLPQRL